MVRSYWIVPVLVVLAVTGPAWSQSAPTAAAQAPKDHTLTIQEMDKPPLKCKVLKMWRAAECKAFLVQAVASGELITIVQPALNPASGNPDRVASKIYHWGDDGKAPIGTPIAPGDALVLGIPAPSPSLRDATVTGGQPRPMPALDTKQWAATHPAVVAQTAPKNIEPPKPDDWRQSWGKVEVAAVPTIDLPHADATRPDPLLQPERYGKMPTVGANNSKPVLVAQNKVETPSKPAEVVISTLVTPTIPVPPVKIPVVAATPLVPVPLIEPSTPKVDSVATKPVDTKPTIPLGMGSIYQAKVAQAPDNGLSTQAKPQPLPMTPPSLTVKANPMDTRVFEGGNAFTVEPPPPAPKLSQESSGAFPAKPPVLPQPGFPQGNPMLRPLQPPQQAMGVMIPMDRGIPSGMTNAFTTGGSSRPIPSDFGTPTQGGNAFMVSPDAQNGQQLALQQAPAYPNAMAMVEERPLPVQETMEPEPIQASNVPQLLAVLRDSLYPSQREWAAESLAALHGSQAQPEVVQGLVTAAKEDPAPSVRACCVRGIVQLRINTMPAVTVVQGLKDDPDPRVRREVEQALPVLTGAQPMPLDPSVRRTSGN